MKVMSTVTPSWTSPWSGMEISPSTSPLPSEVTGGMGLRSSPPGAEKARAGAGPTGAPFVGARSCSPAAPSVPTALLYKCWAQRPSCGLCLKADPRFNCGWCISEHRCQLRAHCPAPKTNWMHPNQKGARCSHPRIAQVGLPTTRRPLGTHCLGSPSRLPSRSADPPAHGAQGGRHPDHHRGREPGPHLPRRGPAGGWRALQLHPRRVRQCREVSAAVRAPGLPAACGRAPGPDLRPDPTPRIVCEMEESLVPSPPPGPAELCIGDCSADFRTHSEQLYSFVVRGLPTPFPLPLLPGGGCVLALLGARRLPTPLRAASPVDAHVRPRESQSGPGLGGHADHHFRSFSGRRQQSHSDRERWRVPVREVSVAGGGRGAGRWQPWAACSKSPLAGVGGMLKRSCASRLSPPWVRARPPSPWPSTAPTSPVPVSSTPTPRTPQ